MSHRASHVRAMEGFLTNQKSLTSDGNIFRSLPLTIEPFSIFCALLFKIPVNHKVSPKVTWAALGLSLSLPLMKSQHICAISVSDTLLFPASQILEHSKTYFISTGVFQTHSDYTTYDLRSLLHSYKFQRVRNTKYNKNETRASRDKSKQMSPATLREILGDTGATERGSKGGPKAGIIWATK